MFVGNIFIRSNVPNVTILYDIICLCWINGGLLISSRNYYRKHWLPLQSSLQSLSLQRDRNFRPLISGGSLHLFPYFPQSQQRPPPSPLRTARKFTKMPLAAISATHDRPSSCRLSFVTEWFVPFDPPFDKTSRYAAAGTADPCMSLSTSALSRLVKGATFISPVWSQSSKSSILISLLSRTHQLPNLVVKALPRARHIQKSLLFSF